MLDHRINVIWRDCMKRYIRGAKRDVDWIHDAINYYLQQYAIRIGSTGYHVGQWGHSYKINNEKVRTDVHDIEFDGFVNASSFSYMSFYSPLNVNVPITYFVDHPDDVRPKDAMLFYASDELNSYQNKYDSDFVLFNELLHDAAGSRFTFDSVQNPNQLRKNKGEFYVKLSSVAVPGITVNQDSYMIAESKGRQFSYCATGSLIWTPETSQHNIEQKVEDIIQHWENIVSFLQRCVLNWPKYNDAVTKIITRLESEFPALQLDPNGGFEPGQKSAEFEVIYRWDRLATFDVDDVFHPDASIKQLQDQLHKLDKVYLRKQSNLRR